MANADRPNGFRPAKWLFGGDWTALIRQYNAADRSADTTNNHGDIYMGDPVTLVAGAVQPANSGDVILGVVVGIGVDVSEFGNVGYHNPDNLEQRFLAFDESGIVGVVPAEFMLFEAQTESVLTLANGAQADISTDATEAHGSRVTGNSSSEVVVAANNDLRVVEQDTRVDNDVLSDNERYFFQFINTLHV